MPPPPALGSGRRCAQRPSPPPPRRFLVAARRPPTPSPPRPPFPPQPPSSAPSPRVPAGEAARAGRGGWGCRHRRSSATPARLRLRLRLRAGLLDRLRAGFQAPRPRQSAAAAGEPRVTDCFHFTGDADGSNRQGIQEVHPLAGMRSKSPPPIRRKIHPLQLGYTMRARRGSPGRTRLRRTNTGSWRICSGRRAGSTTARSASTSCSTSCSSSSPTCHQRNSRAGNAIKAVMERNWDATISYLIAKNYPFVFAVDGALVMAGTNCMFTAGSEGYHIRGLYSACINDSIIRVHMVDDAQGKISILALLDSGSPMHCSGDLSLFSDFNVAERDRFVTGVGGGVTKVPGFGTILDADGRFHMKDVHYIPGLNKPNLIFSLGKLFDDGYGIKFDDEGGCTVIDKRSPRVWSWARLTWTHQIVGRGRKVNGYFHMAYLRMRAPVST